MVSKMDIQERLKLLSLEACVEVADPIEETQLLTPSGVATTQRLIGRLVKSIYVAKAPSRRGTRKVRLLKTLLTNACRNDCRYCATSCLVDRRVISLTPHELATAFMEMYRRGLVSGLFLSSGVHGSADATMEKLIDTAIILRRKLGYRGYLHLKVMPGASEEAIKQAAKFADRLSCNLEAPNASRLKAIAPSKDFEGEIWKTLTLIGDCAGETLKCGYTTQLVVGAAGESDREILSTTWLLYRQHGLHRAYYSGFMPIPGTPMENHPPTSQQRQLRLYQADWLLRFYGFELDELVFDDAGNLPLDVDPKMAWATSHMDAFPVEVNEAPKELLLRVPGIGVTAAERIIKARRERKLTSVEQLMALGVAIERCAPFILLDGKPTTRRRAALMHLPFKSE
ncbi:MAG: hypothetical protein GDYSWBUE_001279 [Candidatus Fervidibacterota bacterium]